MADQNPKPPVRSTGQHPKPVASRRRPIDRLEAIRRVRVEQRRFAPRGERFAHLSRMHD